MRVRAAVSFCGLPTIHSGCLVVAGLPVCALYGRVNYFGIARPATRDNIDAENELPTLGD